MTRQFTRLGLVSNGKAEELVISSIKMFKTSLISKCFVTESERSIWLSITIKRSDGYTDVLRHNTLTQGFKLFKPPLLIKEGEEIEIHIKYYKQGCVSIMFTGETV